VNIAGTITNNSTDKSFTNVSFVGQLYDEENRMITASSGVANLANLGPGQQSAFTITTNLPSEEEEVSHLYCPEGLLYNRLGKYLASIIIYFCENMESR
jgi:hypothetical protein